MAGMLKLPRSSFAITPHKVSVCILTQIYATPGSFVPDPFSSVSHHNSFGLFLLALIKASGGSDSTVLEDDRISLDPSSNLGMFLRRCLLAFGMLTFEAVCHLLSNIESYCKESLPGAELPVDKRRNAKGIDVSPLIPPAGHASDTFDANAGIFLRGHLQLHGYLLEQADEIEKHGSSFPLNTLDSVLQQLQKLAPELHRHNDDSCLTYTLTVICNLLSQFGMTSTTRFLGSSYAPMTSIDSSLTIHQQLYVLLRRVLNRSESLKLSLLVSATRLEMAKFEMMHVQRPMLSFGPKASVSLRTRLAEVCKQCSIPKSVLQQFGSSLLLRATTWEMYGSTSLARINVLVYATCCADTSSPPHSYLSNVRDIPGHLKVAQQACDELGALASPVTGFDSNLKTEVSLRHARTLLAANQFSQAAEVAHSLFCTCYKFTKQVEKASVLLLLAEIHEKSGNAALGLPYALASILFCQSFNLDLLKASATLTLAELWLSHGPSEAQRALALLHGVFPMILGHGGLELCARAHITEAKSHLYDPIHHKPDLVLSPLKEACKQLELLEYHELAAEALYVMAKLGNLEEREKAAASFKEHTLALRNPKESVDDILNTI
ncbi:hypothetical protein Cgig2_017597 [Carnegiea gigantea]|uniref:Anaphase-promoting complex subunit 5 n=1 Tax=Carnegiea gigantea TaxID=171969 RepID=A0A9Q1KNB1_9CARY|nr:hypothetical protein Cgig2_017597 [Carnegiea gigantea]